MNIQRITITDPRTLEETVINVPVNNGEKIMSKEPYVIEYLNRYRTSIGEEELAGISEFERSSHNQLVNDAVIEKTEKSFNIRLNRKYDYKIPVEKEPAGVCALFEEGVQYSYPVAIGKAIGSGISISIANSMKIATKNELIRTAMSRDQSTAYPAVVKRCVNEGYMMDIHGIECFMPGSTASLYKLKDFESILGSSMMVIPISYNEQRDKIVVSHVKFLEAIKPVMIDKIMNEQKDDEFTGTVTLKKHDYLLVTFNECLTGKLSFADMDDETKELFKNGGIEIEKTEVKFRIDYENDGLLTLTQTYFTRKLWEEKVSKEFEPKSVMDGVVIGLTTYNVIVQLKYNVIGSVSRYNHEVSQGDKVRVKILNIDHQKRKIKLAILQ